MEQVQVELSNLRYDLDNRFTDGSILVECDTRITRTGVEDLHPRTLFRARYPGDNRAAVQFEDLPSWIDLAQLQDLAEQFCAQVGAGFLAPAQTGLPLVAFTRPRQSSIEEKWTADFEITSEGWRSLSSRGTRGELSRPR